MSKVIFIDAEHHKVEEREVTSLQELQALVGGYVEAAPPFGILDILYVNEEGRMLKLKHSFMIGRSGILMGNGVLCGPLDADGDHGDVVMPIEVAQKAVIWCSPAAELKQFDNSVEGQISDEAGGRSISKA